MTARTIQKLFDLTGKTALITGGSRGLGLQMAHALGEAGAKIMLSSRKADDLEQAAAELQAAGIDARWIAADCSKEEDTRRLADETLQRMGAVDILVNNAGASWGSPGREPPGRGLGQGDEPQRARLLHPVAAHRQRLHDPEEDGPHHQHRLDRRPERQPARDADAGLQHLEDRGDRLHQARWRPNGASTAST
jgi:hypothetical protein